MRSKIFRNFSLFPKINPYCFNEADKRFNLYQPFVLRVLKDGFRAEGPASVVFPGIPMEIYSSSNTAFLAPASGITRAFIGDSYSDLKVTTNKNCSKITQVKKVSHLEGWKVRWKELLEEKFKCESYRL